MAFREMEFEKQLSLTNSGLTASDCTIIDGGYAKLGNLVVINVRISVTGANPTISNFPEYAGSNHVVAACLDISASASEDIGTLAVLRTTGSLGVLRATSGHSYVITSCYICS